MIYSNDCWMLERCPLAVKQDCANKEDFCIKLFKLDEIYKNSLMTMEQRKRTNFKVDASGVDRDEFNFIRNNIEKDILNFVNEGKSLYIYSSTTGNGKTAWAVRILQDYLDEIWPKASVSTSKVLFISVPRFLISLKQNISSPNQYFNFVNDNVLKADLVVWDEIGCKSVTEFENEHLLNLINVRINEGKSNIFTSNMQPDQLRQQIGDRLYSRVWNSTYKIEFNGKDKRGGLNDSGTSTK